MRVFAFGLCATGSASASPAMHTRQGTGKASGTLGFGCHAVLACVAALSACLLAAPPRPTEVGVDQVILKSGTRLAGAVVQKRDDGSVQVAVQREWLRKRNAAFFQKQEAAERAQTQAALKGLLERIEAWKTERAADDRLVQHLDKEADRLRQREQSLAGEEPVALSRFLLIEVPKPNLESVYVQPPARKQVALVAWQERLDDVEDTPVTKLAAELQMRNIDMAARTVDLSGDLPTQADTEPQWAARRAIIEFYRRKEMTFQGTMDKVHRTDDPAKAPDPAKLFGELMKSQLKAQLDDLLGKPAPAAKNARGDKALEDAGKLADAENAAGFRVTRLSLRPGDPQVLVEGRFLAKLPDGSWLTAWQHVETVDASKPRADLEKLLAENEQVRKVLDFAKSAGLQDEQKVLDALRAGAATMTAQQAVDARFQEFFTRYTERLDGPPLWLPPSK